MAQAGFTPILIYGSTTPGNTPSAANLTTGANGVELAVNAADGKLFYKDAGGTVRVLASIAGLVAGSNTQVQFNDNGVLGASANFTWNGTTLAIGGAITATADSVFSSTGALSISKGTTAQQPGTPATGMIRYNTTTNQFEGYSGAVPAWKSIGGSALSNDTATASNLYPVFAAATSGTAENLYTSDAKYLYKPSTGELQASALVASNGLVVNSATVSTSYSIPSGSNAMSSGPVTIAGGVSVTVPDGSVWTII